MWKTAVLAFLYLIAFSPMVLAQTQSQKQLFDHIQAIKTAKPPSIDGNVSDVEWSEVTPISGFTQTLPDPGEPASLKTEFRILYDDEALYITAHCYDSSPDEIVARLTRRDREIESDWFKISIDSRLDRRTGFFFKVNAAGVQQDGVIYDENTTDTNWDGVWEAKTRIVEDGWVLEIRIPLRLLRFPTNGKVSFGINIERRISRLNQNMQWKYIPPDSSLMVSRFGVLEDLALDTRPIQLSLTPYVAGRLGLGDSADTIRPFDAGLDSKVKFGSNLMLTVTANPDFGQVEADQVVLNLSTIETYLPEKRPFFLEDMSLFRMTKFGDSDSRADIFYTRRIGGLRTAYDIADDDSVVKEPMSPRIWGAGKMAGRTDGGFSVGMLQAVTSEETATIERADGSRYKVAAQPLTSYSLLRTRHEFGDNSTVGMMATATAGKETGQAATGGTDLNWALLDGKYEIMVISRFSYLTEERFVYNDIFTEARLRDNPFGWGGTINLWKKSGEHFVWAVGGEYRSPSLSLNDMGYLDRPDLLSPFVWGQWRRLKRLGPFARLYLNLNGWMYRNTDAVMLGDGGNINGQANFVNNMYVGFYVGYNPDRYDDRETRTAGRVLVSNERTTQAGFWAGTDPGKMLALELSGTYYTTEKKYGLVGSAALYFNPVSFLQFELIPGYRLSLDDVRWLETQNEGEADERFVFSDQHYEYLDLTFRSTCTFTTTLTFQAYAQVFLAAVDYAKKYYGFADGELLILNELEAAPAVPDDYDYTSGDLNIGAVLRWEYLPGSVGYLVYTGVLSEVDDQQASFRYDENFSSLMGAGANHSIMLKLSYMWEI